MAFFQRLHNHKTIHSVQYRQLVITTLTVHATLYGCVNRSAMPCSLCAQNLAFKKVHLQTQLLGIYMPKWYYLHEKVFNSGPEQTILHLTVCHNKPFMLILLSQI